jgi:hypothetical protein
MQGAPLASGTVDVPTFNREALIAALRIDQAGESTFPEFLEAGCNGEEYIEAYRGSKSVSPLRAERDL